MSGLVPLLNLILALFGLTFESKSVGGWLFCYCILLAMHFTWMHGVCTDLTGHWSFVARNSAAFLVSSRGSPMDVWTRGGMCSLDTPLFSEMKYTLFRNETVDYFIYSYHVFGWLLLTEGRVWVDCHCKIKGKDNNHQSLGLELH